MKEQEIIDYLNGNSSKEQELLIERWVMSDPKNASIFNRIKSEHIVSTFDRTLQGVDVDKGYRDFLESTQSSTRKRTKKVAMVLKYAAVVVCALGLGYYFVTQNAVNGEVDFQIPEGAITLELDNGKIQVVSEDGTSQIVDSKGNQVGQQSGKELIYSKETEAEYMVYNTLSIPFGKRFDVTLSDGTKVFLNAGSSLRYPVKFLRGQQRVVYLEGEAFFDVAKDSAHPFIVNAVDMDIKVLGTKFNVSAYPEDDFSNTVLVEGSVSLSNDAENSDKKESLLEPGHIAQWNKGREDITIEEADTDLYTAWIGGKVVFKHMPFDEIIKKLERHYDVEISNLNSTLNEEFFTASFDIETIDQVLQTFQKNYDIHYTITGRKITIN